MNGWPRYAAALLIVVAIGGAAAAQESLSTARDLYAGAAYEEALLLLNRLRAGGARADEARAIEQYRAFCLLALGRSADAEQAIEAVVSAEPSYQPSDRDVSPRVRAAFTDVRRRVLPAIAQQRYATAKAAYDRKEFAAAAAGFRAVLAVLAEPELAATAGQPPLSDIRTLAAGFHDLSATAAAPAPPPPAPLPSVPRPPAQAPVTPPLPVTAPAPERVQVAAAPGPTPRIYSVADSEVIPPVILRQFLPPFPVQSGMTPTQGSVEVVIDESGAVELAVMRTPLMAAYDRLALAAARTWQYKPATLNGVPVKYRKTVQIAVAVKK